MPNENQKPKKKKRRVRSFFRALGFFLVTLILVGLTSTAICGVAFAYYINEYVSADVDIDLESFRLNFTSFIYYIDKNTGREVELGQLHGSENRVWADYDEIPQRLKDAFIAVEDNTFETHNGVNWKRTIGAAMNYIVKFRSGFGGGSTITQQLIKNLTGDDETSVKRKIQEVMRALELEKNYDKKDILEMYLNTIYFGQSSYGVRQAAYTYFGKELDELTLAECASIAGITKNPYKYDMFRFPEKNAERRAVVLEQMKRYEKISEAEYQAAMAEDVQAVRDNGKSDSGQYQSYFVDAIIDAVIEDLKTEKGYSSETAKLLLFTGGLKIIATIDMDIQNAMDQVFTDLDNFPGVLGPDGTMPQAAMVVMDPYTGYVKALYGGRGEKQGNRVLNRATQTKRAPGSSIKPLTVYAPAIEEGLITPITVIDDVPKDFTIRESGWPKNENQTYSGKTTIYRGIAQSLNTIAVDVVTRLTPAKSFDFGRNRLNLSTLVESRTITRKNGDTDVQTDIAISPMALGGLTDGVTVLSMAGAYSAFTNDGYYTEPVLYSKVYNSSGELLLDNTPLKTEAMSSKTATYMLELLKYAVSNGTGSRAALGNGIEVGGKTGTTTSNNDRWFAGVTPYYTGVVWFGYDKQQEVTGVTTNPALYLWKEVMAKVHDGLEPRKFTENTELVPVSYCMDSGLAPNSYCSQDARGSRVATAYIAKEDAPTETCGCHMLFDVCGQSGLRANEYCPLGEVAHRVKLYIEDRNFPVGVAVTDSAYCFYPGSYCNIHSVYNNGNLEIPPVEEPTPGEWPFDWPGGGENPPEEPPPEPQPPGGDEEPFVPVPPSTEQGDDWWDYLFPELNPAPTSP